ncbi:HIT domain-containing protein [Candidatus Saccharibacteria bacterium]|jgi:histidine triad (HIT) family protein|nr:HIT domain-containing protein [Candidatus Saccharibacteria bacterium]
MTRTIFSKIIDGEIPCHKVYEDDLTFAFMDIYPVAPGHVLVVSKNPVEFVWDLPKEDYKALQDTVKKIALRQREVLGVPYVGQQIIGVDVPHAHIHLIPFRKVSEYRHQPDATIEPNHQELAKIATKLRLQ